MQNDILLTVSSCYKADEVIGQSVENHSGDTIGEVEDLIFGANDRALSAVLSVGGFLGMGEHHVAVRYSELAIVQSGDDLSVKLNASKEQLKGMAEFDYDKADNTYFVHRASQVIGQTVKNAQGDSIGTIDDLLIGRDDKIPSAIVSVGGFLGIGAKDVAVPFARFEVGTADDTDQLILAATKDHLKAMPEFTRA